MAAVTWTESARDGMARSGSLQTPHGIVNTPAFIPVGTRAAVKAVDSDDLASVGVEIILANTYHLILRPGSDVIEELGGLHNFMDWGGPILTDSGGFQIFSLGPKITEEDAVFKSVYDGSTVRLGPEDAVAAQQKLGSDIAMVLDICVGLPADRDLVETEMRRTLRWAERSLEVEQRSDQALFGIVQGGVDPNLRVVSARETTHLGFPGFGIGGLSVGESAAERNIALDATMSELPPDKPRYVMGLGDTDGLLDAVARGADLFDCVIPTRLGRHGKALTRLGDFNVRQSAYRSDAAPIDEECACTTCRRHSRAYLHHLVRRRELSAHRLLSIHNLQYTMDLISGARDAIETGSYDAYLSGVREARARGSS